MLTTHKDGIGVKVLPNDRGNPPGKVADVELHFTAGVLAGLKLGGFAVWERRGGSARTVTFPARQYTVNAERRSFALLRPIIAGIEGDALRAWILEAVALHETASETEQAS